MSLQCPKCGHDKHQVRMEERSSPHYARAVCSRCKAFIKWLTKPGNKHQVDCPECGRRMVLRVTRKFTYKDGSPRKFYGCPGWPACKGTHGCDKDGKPYGKPGDEKTKRARMDAHEVFDRLWKDKHMSRDDAYEWMQAVMNMTESEAHIGNFDVSQCARLRELAEEKLIELEED